MLTILIRTVLVYVILIATMRIMGKRQLGVLEISELVTTLLISEIASLPIVEQSIPIMFAIIPLITILTIEVILSMILLKCPRLKNLASSRPSILIRHGTLDQKELRRNRISIDELISEARQAGFSSLEDIDYAIVEQNGKISILPLKKSQPPCAEELGIQSEESGIVHVLIADGQKNEYNLQLLGISDAKLSNALREANVSFDDLFFLGCDDAGNFHWIKKEDTL